VLLGSGFRRAALRSMDQIPAASISSLSKSSVPSKSSSLRLTPLQAKSRLSQPDARSILGQLPLIFEANQGQADSRVKFLARGTGYSLFLDETSAVLTMQTARSTPSQQYVRMKLVGANSAAATAGTNPLPGKSNYIFGNDPHRWHTGIPQFAGVRCQSVYPGIDLVFYGKEGRLEYDFKVAPGADPSQAELQFEGADKLKLSGGDLIDVYKRQPVALLGTWALVVNGTFFAAMSLRTRSRELMLPLLLFPVSIPAVIAMVAATTSILTGEDSAHFYIVLLVTCLLYTSRCV